MAYANIGGIRDLLKQYQAIEFYRDENKDFSILTDSHINHDQIHHVNNNWLDHIFLSPEDSHTEGLLVLFFIFLFFFYKMIYTMNKNLK